MAHQFYFADITNTETQTFDNSLEHFHSSGISGTIRENIQNSIDAQLPGTQDPVNVQIEVTTIAKKDIPGIKELEEHIKALVGGNSYTVETVEYMKKALAKDQVNVLTFEDTNTKGLSGATKLGQKTTYNTFSYKKGVHYEDTDNQVELVRGGSHGVGKIANNAASDIHLMYFSNCDEEDNQHIGGTIQLIEHQMGDASYRSTGYFSDINDAKQYVPYKNEGYHEIFKKETRGLKLVVPFLRESYADLAKIVTAVCDNFFLALLTNKLEVTVTVEGETVEINSETVQSISQKDIYYPANLSNISEIKKVFTPLYIDSYLTVDPIKLEVSSNTSTYTFDLYFIYNEDIKTGRVGIIRSMGMKIVDYKVKNHVRKPFNAVLIGGPKEDDYLKTLENESHTELSPNSLRDKQAKKDASKFLRNLNQAIGEKIEQEWAKLNPSDGKIDTSDLLYEKEITFKSKMETLSEKIELDKGKEVLRKKNQKEKRETQNSNTIKERMNQNPEPRVRKPRKIKPNKSDNTTNDVIIPPNEVVERVVVENKEFIQFNLESIKDISPTGRVNIKFRVVDGDGKEYDNEFNLLASYLSVADDTKGYFYEYDDYTIYNVDIVNSVIKLKLTQRNNRSSTLKFIYKLEVLP